MKFAPLKQNLQDWITQQWAIISGKQIEPDNVPWLIGPFGNPSTEINDFAYKVAKEEGLTIERDTTSNGLLSSIKDLKLSDEEFAILSKNVADFYENTMHYELKFSVKWNPLFKIFGKLINYLFSNRINQLNIPIQESEHLSQINSEIITLLHPATKEVQYKIWQRTFKSTGQTLYSGVYSTCQLPSGRTCIKAVFPLPNGNATVIMSPSVGSNGELYLESSGKKFGDAGFYFLLNDSKGRFWSKYISSFCDQLIVANVNGNMIAEQNLTL